MKIYVWALWAILTLIPLNLANAGTHFSPYTFEQDASTPVPSLAGEEKVAQAHPESGNAPSIDGPSLPDFESRFAKGSYQLGLTFGYGFSINIPPVDAVSDERTRLRFVHIAPNFKYNLTGIMGKSIYRGALYWVVEAAVALTIDNPRRNNQVVDEAPTFLIALVPAQLEYKFVNPGWPWGIFVFAGIGGTWGDWFLETNELATAFNFVLQGGGGIEYFFANGTALNFNYRLWHLSNSNIKGPNIGINAHIFGLGYSF